MQAEPSFIVEDYPEDEYGQWAIDEATGEQGYVDDERSCFWTWDDNDYTWQSRKFQDPKSKEEKVKEKVKAKVASKELVRHTLVKNKLKTLSGGQKKMVFGGSREKEAKKALRKVRTTFLKVILVPTIQKRVQYHSYKGRGKDQKRKGKESSRNVDSLQ